MPVIFPHFRNSFASDTERCVKSQLSVSRCSVFEWWIDILLSTRESCFLDIFSLDSDDELELDEDDEHDEDDDDDDDEDDDDDDDDDDDEANTHSYKSNPDKMLESVQYNLKHFTHKYCVENKECKRNFWHVYLYKCEFEFKPNKDT